MIHERVVRDSVWLRMTSKDDKTRTCSYSKLSGFGHTIYGKRLTYKEILPNKCAMKSIMKNFKSFKTAPVFKQCNLERPFFNLLHKIIQFSDIMRFSDSFCGHQKCP